MLAGDARHVLAGATALSGSPFDLVLLDPPYALDEATLAGVLAALVDHLAPGATIVVERAAKAPGPSWPATLVAAQPRRYGATALHRADAVPGPEGRS